MSKKTQQSEIFMTAVMSPNDDHRQSQSNLPEQPEEHNGTRKEVMSSTGTDSMQGVENVR